MKISLSSAGISAQITGWLRIHFEVKADVTKEKSFVSGDGLLRSHRFFVECG
jgi:hypothetical protein